MIDTLKHDTFSILMFIHFLFTGNGNWGPWGNWGKCSVTCNPGTKTRQRECNNPPQKGTGKPCEGETLDFAPCRERDCGEAGK